MLGSSCVAEQLSASQEGLGVVQIETGTGSVICKSLFIFTFNLVGQYLHL
jgi:hypothetical protein